MSSHSSYKYSDILQAVDGWLDGLSEHNLNKVFGDYLLFSITYLDDGCSRFIVELIDSANAITKDDLIEICVREKQTGRLYVIYDLNHSKILSII